MVDLDWNKKKFVIHAETEESYPSHYLKCEKLVDGVWVNTGWAPHEKAVKQHAEAIGGDVRAMTDNGLLEFKEVDKNLEACDTACSEHS